MIKDILYSIAGIIVFGIIIILAIFVLSLFPRQLGDSFFDMYRQVQ